MTTETDPIQAGIEAADGPEKTREYADVRAWGDKIDRARKFDEPARKQMAKDRRCARGDTGAEVATNIAGTNIDILEAFMFAKNPDVDCLPAKACEPPSIHALRDAAEEMVKTDPNMQALLQQAFGTMMQAYEQAAIQGQAQGTPPPPPPTMDMALDAMVGEQFKQLQTKYAKRQRDNKAFAETLELVIGRMWQDASLKKRGRPWVRSGLTVGVGILKASWQERTAPSPETMKAINDLQDNIKRAAAQRAALEESDPGIFQRVKQGVMGLIGKDDDAKLADYQRQLVALQGQAEQVVARGFVIDVVQAEDFQIPPGYTIADHCDAPWNAHRIPMLALDAQARFGLTDEQLKECTRYTARAVETCKNEAAILDDAVTARDADAYKEGGSDDGGDWVMCWEIWDQESNHVLTRIEGLKCWAKPAWQPTATTRFYPFFLFTTSELDGQRHPQSLVTRTMKLIDEYNRIGSAEAEHRRRILPGILFNEGSMDADQVRKVERSVAQEYTGIKPTNPKADMRALFAPKPYAPLDPAVYDRARIKLEIDGVFGVSEALQSSVTVQKTLGEAEIQQSGFQARNGGRRDVMESGLQELAQYTAEVAHAHMDIDDVAAIAGPNAMWPEYKSAADLNALVSVEIRAGSSGKPNTSAERQAMAAGLPLYQAGIDKIGMLRNSTPEDVADCHEMLIRIFAERSGDRMDMDGLIPKAGPAPALPVPGQPPGAPPGAPPQPGAPATDPTAAPAADPLAA